MKEFVKMTLAAMLGFFLIGVVFFFFSLAIIGSIAALGSSQPVMPRTAVLSLDFSKFTVSEQTTEADPISQLQGNNTAVVGIWSAIQAIDAAAADPAIKYMFMRPDMASGGIAEIEELRSAIENFRNSGKAVVSYMETPTNAGYYLASASDKIFMSSHEGTMNMISGFSARLIFLKDILDKLGVNVQLIRHGKYKSAGEMYIRSEASPENLLQNQEMVDAIWDNWTSTIASAREISQSDFNALIDNLELNFSEDFLDNGLVDELLTKDQLRQKLSDLYDAGETKDVPMVSLADYAKLKVMPNFKAKNKIAIIYANGNIVDGNEPEQVAGDRFASIISKVRQDSTVKAVVFRVSSPGGSVFASEKIKSEIDLLRADKPVIASYGAYAASGGYWISSTCDYIFTNAGTLTGSIGVFSMVPDFSKTLKDIAHVNITNVTTNRHGDMYSGTRPLDKEETAYMQASVERIYDRFTSIVAEGRDLDKDFVDSIAQGRVWAGSDALELGLVDRIGTIKDAVIYAAASAGSSYGQDLSDWQIVEYPKPLTTMEKIMETFGGSSAKVFAGTPLEDVEEAFTGWKNTESGKVYARIPYEIEIR
ncbi:MAG: signal peptide peptidase SppA [Bacteroidetes bacterium]|uniref:Signal peptide peptidase SppA n=1 Tax=Candidatus Cryptobacteroides excrementipullorum TaxID=2840761 RepID=A0A9D9IVT2_9BACT|nr:signal peptide peptidase SppA [Candidatus Cryptobacteroides excrementipullorum]